MYSVPESYKKDFIINKENFIPTYLNSRDKKKIRKSLKRVRLKYQIDKGILDLVNELYNIQVIMILEVELNTTNNIEYVNQVFQNLIKGYAIIKYIYKDNVLWGYGFKRLNKQNKNEVILEDSFVTQEYEEMFLFDDYNLYKNYLDFGNIKNKSNKLELYLETMAKAYLISNRKYFKEYRTILDSDIYYSLESTFKLYEILKKIVQINIQLKNKKTTAEKIELNKTLSNLNKDMEGLLNGRY